ncbi:hypothetical protein [Streptomyces hawaiiensis]|uniref:hypothetical protein n=1 Tax=Streptomyces hawaiiensis TaxID=67305 RepID=UPI001586C9AF|nr:hypothetical protein [Streptomyces hawaiiensis]
MTDSRAGRRSLISVGFGAYKDSGIADLPGTVADAAVDNQLIICFANDMALFER